MRIIAHHTCDLKGDIAKIEVDGAFLSEHLENDPTKHKMLGTGYYFFDNNITMAHAHGKNRYKRKYYIFEAELHLHEDVFLDLVGNRTQMIMLTKIIEKLSVKIPASATWSMGQLIEFLKLDPNFPYKAIRVFDHSYKGKDDAAIVATMHQIAGKYGLSLMPNTKKFINLQPVYTICLLEKDPTIIKQFKHIYTNV